TRKSLWRTKSARSSHEATADGSSGSICDDWSSLRLSLVLICGTILAFPFRTNSLNVGHRKLTRPAFVELRVLTSRYRIGLAHFNQNRCLNTLSKDQRTSRSQRGQLIEKLAVNSRNDLPEIPQIFRILKPVNDEAVALRQHRL